MMRNDINHHSRAIADTAHKRILSALSTSLLLAVLSACTAIHPPSAYLPNKDGIEPGETITVRASETVYGIARANNVSMRELISLNDLKPPYEIRPGQSLVLPANGASFGEDVKAPTSAPLDVVERNQLAPITPPPVTTQTLEPAPYATQPPQQLQPAVTQQSPVQALNSPLPEKPQPTTAVAPPAPPQVKEETPPPAQHAATGVKIVWPVQGPILSKFGTKSAGLSNDGINIGAPKGAPVVAAAPGTVMYSGNEMKGFGNLVLIKHQGELVTAYAHLDRVLVRKDSVVAQGDMIGTVGRTGNVSSPQLHFEVRRDNKPVDPEQVVKN